MAEPFGDQLNPGSGKRPAPTIEGTATEVSIDAAPGETGSPDPAVEAETSDPEGSEPKHGPKKPPPRTSPTELKGFFTHLAAGLLGGLIGVVALALFWNKLPVRNAAAPDLTPIEGRLAKLESAPPPAGDTAALGALDARVKTLEDRKVETPPDLSDLTSRVTRLEESINALAETAKEGGSVPDAAALDAKIGDLEQRLQGKIDSALAAQQGESTTDLKDLQKEVEALKAKLGALAEAHLAGDTSDLAPQLTTLDQRIAKLEAALPELSTAIDRSSASAKSGAAAIAFANLRNAVAAGRPYAAELAALKSLVPDPGDLGALPAHAETGIPTVAALADTLTKLAEASAAPHAGPSPDLDPRQHDGEREVGDFHPPHRRRRDRRRACRRAGKSRSGAEPGRSCRRHQGGRVAACARARRLCRLARRCAGAGLRERHIEQARKHGARLLRRWRGP